MNKLKTFFTTLFNSFTDPNYYADVVAAKFSFSFKYFIIFYIFLSLIISTTVTSVANQQLPTYVESSLNIISDFYPEDLEIDFDVENSILSTQGADEPIIIPAPTSEYFQVDQKNLLVIDTNASAEKIEDYETIILLTKTHLATTADESIGFQIIPLSDISDAMNDQESGHAITKLTLNKSFITDNTPLIKNITNDLLSYLPYIIFFGGFLLFFISRLLILLFLSIFNHLFSSILGKGLSYKKAYQIGLHTITITDIIIHLQKLLFDYPSSLFGFIFIGISSIAIMGIKNKKTPKKFS